MPNFTDFSKLTGAQLAAQPAGTRTFEEVWAELNQRNITASQIMEGNGPSLQELIEQAKIKLASGATKTADQDDLPTVEAVDKATVKQLHALANEAKTARDEAAAQYEAIKQVLKDMLGPEDEAAEILTVNGAPVATWKKSTTVILNQSAIKKQFSREQFPELYTEQQRRTFLLK